MTAGSDASSPASSRARHVAGRELPRPVALVGDAADLPADELAQVAVEVQQQVAG